MEEYKEDDLTVDSNDGKRLEKAEQMAERKVAAKRKKQRDDEARKEPRLGHRLRRRSRSQGLFSVAARPLQGRLSFASSAARQMPMPTLTVYPSFITCFVSEPACDEGPVGEGGNDKVVK